VRVGDYSQRISEVIEIWKGRYNGKAVALKVLKVSHQDPHIPLFKRVSMLCDPLAGVAPPGPDILQRLCPELVWIKQSEHRNILPLYGVSTTIAPFCLVYPWCKNENILEYLRKEPDADRFDLVSTFRQIPCYRFLSGPTISYQTRPTDCATYTTRDGGSNP